MAVEWRPVVIRCLSFLAVLAFAAPSCGQSAVASGGPPPAPRELRAAWIATVDNIDWPSREGLSVSRQRQELLALLERARFLRLNALIFQVRPACDALYPSPHEPWSEWLTGTQGEAPSPRWDPLEFAVAEAHARGIELHAWFNPFRARHSAADSPDAPDHVTRVPGMTVAYGDQRWLDPGLPAARAHSLRVIFDVVDRYDIDGVHLDDYFYPYPVDGRAFPDDASYRRYGAREGGMTRGEWRRHNVDSFVEALAAGIKERKPWVKFGISPFGIARPGVPPGIEAGLDQYDQLYADVRKWLARGWCDYMVPQLYWPIDQRAQSYPVLLDWWARQNARGRHLWIGNFSSKTIEKRGRWSVGEVLDQIQRTRAERGATGNVHFSMRALTEGTELGRALHRGPYFDHALVPASPWLDDEEPAAPDLRVSEAGDGGLELRWSADPEVFVRAVYLRCGGRWRLVEVLPQRSPGMRLTRDDLLGLRVSAVAVSAVDRCGNESPRVLRDVR